jgi:hypothetical protein
LEPDGGEGGFGRVGGAQVDPVLGGVVVERKQDVEQGLIIARRRPNSTESRDGMSGTET